MRLARAVACGLFLLAGARTSAANDTEETRKTLAGMREFMVSCQVDEDLEAADLDSLMIQADAELKLRQSGIRVVKLDKVRNIDTAMLCVAITAFELEESPPITYVYELEIAVKQAVSLLRRPAVVTLANTWSTSLVGYVDERAAKSSLRDNLRDQLDLFLNAYLAANPRPAGSK
jgi:hypothetical protein